MDFHDLILSDVIWKGERIAWSSALIGSQLISLPGTCLHTFWKRAATVGLGTVIWVVFSLKYSLDFYYHHPSLPAVMMVDYGT